MRGMQKKLEKTKKGKRDRFRLLRVKSSFSEKEENQTETAKG